MSNRTPDEIIELLGGEKTKLQKEVKEFEEEVDFYFDQAMGEVATIMKGFVQEKNTLITETNHSIFKLKDAVEKVNKTLDEIQGHREKCIIYKESVNSSSEVKEKKEAPKDKAPNYAYKKKAF